MDRAERVLEELAGLARVPARGARSPGRHLYEAQGDWAKALKIFHELPANVQAERAQVAAHYLCELAEQALVQGEAERASTLLRQARTHDAQLPRADILAARIAEAGGDAAAALVLYLHALPRFPRDLHWRSFRRCWVRRVRRSAGDGTDTLRWPNSAGACR